MSLNLFDERSAGGGLRWTVRFAQTSSQVNRDSVRSARPALSGRLQFQVLMRFTRGERSPWPPSLLLLRRPARAAAPGDDERAYPVPADCSTPRGCIPPPPADRGARRGTGGSARRAAARARPSRRRMPRRAARWTCFCSRLCWARASRPERVPKTAAFLRRVYSSAMPYLQATKDAGIGSGRSSWTRRSRRWRDRWPAPARIPRSASPPMACRWRRIRRARRPRRGSYSPSYPSGHATVGAMMAILLAEMVPERRARCSHWAGNTATRA